MTSSRPRPPRLVDVVSVVLITYQQADLVGPILRALANQTYTGTFEVVCSDNNSTDGTVAVLDAFTAMDPRFRRVSSSRGQGAAVARNDGVAGTRGSLLLFLDGDDEPSATWLERMVAAAPDLDVIGGQLEQTKFNAHFWTGSDVTFQHPVAPNFSPFVWVIGANIGMWRDVFDAVGGFPEDFGVAQDVCFCFLAQLAGFTVGSATDAVVHVRIREGLGPALRRQFRYGTGYPHIRAVLGDRATRATNVHDLRWWVVGTGRLARQAIRDPRKRRVLLERLADESGRVWGSAKYRVLAL